MYYKMSIEIILSILDILLKDIKNIFMDFNGPSDRKNKQNIRTWEKNETIFDLMFYLDSFF